MFDVMAFSSLVWPHLFLMRDPFPEDVEALLATVEDWCATEFGPDRWRRDDDAFWFKHETDACAFRLRWC